MVEWSQLTRTRRAEGWVYERVYTVNEYYDGPRLGVADFHGIPHIYKSRYADFSGGHNTFQLMPINQDAFRLVLENWAIWRRWQAAFNEGRTTIETHPALPEDRARNAELTVAVETALTTIDSSSVEACCHFVEDEGEEWWVHWTLSIL